MPKEKKPEKKKHNKGEMSFGLEVLLFIILIFIIWVLMGGAKKRVSQDPLLTPDSGQIIPKGAF